MNFDEAMRLFVLRIWQYSQIPMHQFSLGSLARLAAISSSDGT